MNYDNNVLHPVKSNNYECRRKTMKANHPKQGMFVSVSTWLSNPWLAIPDISGIFSMSSWSVLHYVKLCLISTEVYKAKQGFP
jgi:hypothetical protein